MIRLEGKYNTAVILADRVEESCVSQVYDVLNNPGFGRGRIVIMPDLHAGKGSVIGFTMELNEYICPNVVGVDIGCGVYAYNLGKVDVDFKELDFFIKKFIPSGHDVHSRPLYKPNLKILEIIRKVAPEKEKRFLCSVGTLGGGNHFIELDRDPGGNIWLVIHSGSRNLGLMVCNYHAKKAKEFMERENKLVGSSALAYMPLDRGGDKYLKDMKVIQEYANDNREMMVRIIIEKFFNQKFLKNKNDKVIHSVHNYVDFRDNIIRKGAISAHEGERVLIPLNMRDGTIVATGKGNPGWNFSAPHGAGRILSRTQAKKSVNLERFIESMKGIYSSSVGRKTLDEAPMVYKPPKEILSAIDETAHIDFIMKPIYNFKG